nr:MAG TPA: hypothetical protein [Caudoviricetes sp.]
MSNVLVKLVTEEYLTSTALIILSWKSFRP